MDSKQLDAAIHAGRIAGILDALEATNELARRRWLRDGLRRAVEHADPGSVGEPERQRLAACGWAQAELDALAAAPPPTAVHVPLVPVGPRYGTSAKATPGAESTADATVTSGLDPFYRLMVVSYDPSGSRALRERYDAAARAAIGDGLRAAAEGLGRPFVDGFTLLPYRTGTIAKLRIAGASPGAATAVAAAARWSRRAVLHGTAVTGRVAGERVAAVGGMDAKVAALLHRPDIERLVVPAEDLPVASALARERGLAARIVGVSTVSELLDACLEAEARPEQEPEHAVAAAREAYDRGWQGWQWPALVERLERLVMRVPARRPDLQVRVLAMLGAAHRNLGDPAQGLEMKEEALAVLQTEEAEIAVPDDARTFLYRNMAVTLRQLCRFDEALAAAREAERCAREGRLRGDVAFALGTRGLVHMSLGEHEHAVACQREAQQHLLRHSPRHAPRTGSQLVEALGRAGRPHEARQCYRESMELVVRHVDESRRRTDEQWLRTQLAGALRDPPCADEVRELLQAPCMIEAMERAPMPGLLAARWLGLAEIDLGRRSAGYARLAASPMAHPQARDPHLRLLAHLNVLYEGRARAAHGDLDHDAVARMRHALTHLPQTDAVAHFLSPGAEEMLSALELADVGHARSHDAELRVRDVLDRFLDTCARIG